MSEAVGRDRTLHAGRLSRSCYVCTSTISKSHHQKKSCCLSAYHTTTANHASRATRSATAPSLLVLSTARPTNGVSQLHPPDCRLLNNTPSPARAPTTAVPQRTAYHSSSNHRRPPATQPSARPCSPTPISPSPRRSAHAHCHLQPAKHHNAKLVTTTPALLTTPARTHPHT